jgi:hypothetical protein
MKKNDQHQKYKELRKQYPEFCYQSFNYAIEEGVLKIEYHFHLSNQYHFYPTHELPVAADFTLDSISKAEIDNLVFHLGMVELISYWKAACPPQLIIKPYSLNNTQIAWWKKLYFQGLGEFFYLNGIETNEEDFVEIISNDQHVLKAFNTKLTEKIMVPIGGGKDSVVSLETLKALDKKLIPFVVNPRGATKESIENAGFSLGDAYFTKRSIHSQLLELNKEGFLNGHTPFSAMLAFLSLIAARINNAQYIALSNESSANESTVEGTHINHQYSKSFEFENDFRNYYKEHISSDFEYFSFLRPISELQIAALFSQLPQHYFSFKSCNVGSKKNIWCGSCPKCLFTYILMSPFIPTEKLHKIFGKALLNDSSLKPIFEELRGKTASKPFECVGTIDEVEWSLQHAQKEIYEEALLKESDVKRAVKSDNVTLKQWNKEHFLKKEFEEVLKSKLSV